MASTDLTWLHLEAANAETASACGGLGGHGDGDKQLWLAAAAPTPSASRQPMRGCKRLPRAEVKKVLLSSTANEHLALVYGAVGICNEFLFLMLQTWFVSVSNQSFNCTYCSS